MKRIWILAFAFYLQGCEFLGVTDYTTMTLHEEAEEDADTIATPSSSASTADSTGSPSSTDAITIDTIILNASTLSLKPGQMGQLKLDVTLSNQSRYSNVSTRLDTPYGLQTDVMWFSNNSEVVTVSSSGKLTGITPGTTTVKASLYNESVLATVTVAEESHELVSLAFTQTYSQTSNALPRTLTFNATIDNGTLYTNLSAQALQDLTGEAVIFDSSNTSAAIIDENGVFMPLANGETTFIANCDEAITSLTLQIKGFDETAEATDDLAEEAETTNPSEDPDDILDRFLNANDILTLAIGEDGGFGSTNFPDVAYGAPVSSRTDVVSLGRGGEVTIELNGYVIVDGPGNDFTVFENAFTGWSEPAYVSVSADGVTYFTFSCDPWDGDALYVGCAGIAEVNYSSLESDYWDDSLSGGDSFDLADLGLDSARFIKITDADACPDPAVCVANVAGFDLDALAIVNGANVE